MMIQPQNRESMQNIFLFGLNSYLMDKPIYEYGPKLMPCKIKVILFDGYLITVLNNTRIW